MKYKIAICDDSNADRQYILNMVDCWALTAGHVVHIDTFISAENFLFHYAEESDYDILLLDIEILFKTVKILFEKESTEGFSEEASEKVERRTEEETEGSHTCGKD